MGKFTANLGATLNKGRRTTTRLSREVVGTRTSVVTTAKGATRGIRGTFGNVVGDGFAVGLRSITWIVVR